MASIYQRPHRFIRIALHTMAMTLSIIPAAVSAQSEVSSASELGPNTSTPLRNLAEKLGVADIKPSQKADTKDTTPMPMPLTYPKTRAVLILEHRFGLTARDPYRWLEGDVRQDKKVESWVADQNSLSMSYLHSLPGKKQLAERMNELLDYERSGVPTKAGSHLFFERNDGLQNQAVLYVQDTADAPPRALIDPNTWAADGTDALADWTPSEDGSLLAYSVQQDGSDWRAIRFMDVTTGKTLPDRVQWVKFSGISWLGNEGVYYSRFPEPADKEAFQALNYNHAIYFHRLGEAQTSDTKIYATPDNKSLNHFARVTSDNQYLVITSSSGTDEKYAIHVQPLTGGGALNAPVRTLIGDFDNEWTLVDGVGDTLYFITDKGAPRKKLVALNAAPGFSLPRDIVPQRTAAMMSASIIGNQILIELLANASSVVEIYDMSGSFIKMLDVGEIGVVSGLAGKPDDPETYFALSSFTRPATIYRYNSATGERLLFTQPELTFNPDDYVTERRFFASKDGTKIPLFIVYRKDLDLSKTHPTLLYGYGGFNVSLTPSYSATRMAWLEAGGIYAQASLRGGGEYGKEWHDSGRLLHKQNVFDDFIGAGEYLMSEGFTGKGQLAIDGRSNGGLLIGAVINQRPDLFAAGHAGVGVMDMLRYNRSTAGRYWVDDYGDPSVKEHYVNLRTYSPYHNIPDKLEAGKSTYPAIIVTTADTDDRVVPMHSFKYVARLQAADLGPKPRIIRIETGAGHGAGKPLDKTIDEASDIFAFLGNWTGLFGPLADKYKPELESTEESAPDTPFTP